MNRRKADKEYDIPAQQAQMARVFRIFRVVIGSLIAIALACTYFALSA